MLAVGPLLITGNMVNTYKSNTPCVISVSLSNGSYRYIKFAPLSRGGGIYTTCNALEQEALENHRLYKIRYKLIQSELSAEEKEAQENQESKATEEAKAEEPVQANEVTSVEVTDIEEARDYLNEHYGVAKRNMRSTAAVKAVAEQNGIKFVGI